MTKNKALIIGGLLLAAAIIKPYATVDEYAATVNKTMVKNDTYLVYTDKGTFEMTDSLAFLRFSTSDEWGKVKENTKYNIKATGWRLPLFSMYENIISIETTK